MRKKCDIFELSATDLVSYLNCRHLSALERGVAEGHLKKPYVSDPLLKILWERGSIHEQNYIEHLTKVGLEVIRIEGFDVSPEAVDATIAAMRRGAQIIAQGAFSHQGWVGRADILSRIEVPSLLGAWSYEAIDTKLARETKAGAVLQLCLYSDLIRQSSGSGAGAHVCRGALVRFQTAAIPVCRLRGLFPARQTGAAEVSERARRAEKLSRAERALRNVCLAGGVRTAAPG
jgi:predicted RecB family nuclease